MSPVDSRTVATRLGRLRVQTGGSREAMLYWPSLLMTGDMWAGQASEFRADHTVALVDPPGHGGSETLLEPFAFDDGAGCVVDVIDELGIGRQQRLECRLLLRAAKLLGGIRGC